jgi:flagellar biosynthetic protein FliO
MNSQQPPDWNRRFLAWLSRQPRWLIASGVVVLLALGTWLMSDMNSQAAIQQAPGPAGDPFLNSTALALGVFARLILVVAAIYIAAMLFRRWQTGSLKGAARQLALVETLHLSQRRSLHLVRAGEQVFLIGATDQAVTLLGQVASTPGESPTGEMRVPMAGLSFDEHFSLANQKKDEQPGTN